MVRRSQKQQANTSKGTHNVGTMFQYPVAPMMAAQVDQENYSFSSEINSENPTVVMQNAVLIPIVLAEVDTQTLAAKQDIHNLLQDIKKRFAANLELFKVD
ncbi:Hypothetical predicted protein [Pelobates cultripes]|uniref:Uncharacterized protein n=1 Tax=Pelobates cultripes TaxID=61616 RepID=A0AAD1SSK7_PELCU|nr:Hypothetical predicted protein [Pelobates cultripes]